MHFSLFFDKQIVNNNLVNVVNNKCICLQIERVTAPPPEGEAGEGKILIETLRVFRRNASSVPSERFECLGETLRVFSRNASSV